MSVRYDDLLLLGVELGQGDAPTQELRERVQAAVRVYREAGPLTIVACGGVTPGHAVAEADVMAALLAQAGVPERDVLREDCSQSTIENMRFAARLLGGARGKRVLVVTSDYHVRRAVMTARRMGFRAKGVPAVLRHDEGWRRLRAKELGYTVDLLMGWQDEGRTRPAWTYRLFDAVFGGR